MTSQDVNIAAAKTPEQIFVPTDSASKAVKTNSDQQREPQEKSAEFGRINSTHAYYPRVGWLTYTLGKWNKGEKSGDLSQSCLHPQLMESTNWLYRIQSSSLLYICRRKSSVFALSIQIFRLTASYNTIDDASHVTQRFSLFSTFPWLKMKEIMWKFSQELQQMLDMHIIE